MDRLTLLPTELKKQIFTKITDTKTLLRLLTVSREVAVCTEKFCFEKIKSIEIYCTTFDVSPCIINGDEVPWEYLYSVMRLLWKRAKNITYLKLTGHLYAKKYIRSSVYDQIVDIMGDQHRALKELHIYVHTPFNSPFSTFFNGVENIIANVTDSLEKLWFGCSQFGIPELYDAVIDVIGKCMYLKEIYLDQLYVTGSTAHIICRDKSLSTVSIVQHDYYNHNLPSPAPFPADDIFTGILRGLDPYITHLHLQLTDMYTQMWSLSLNTVKIFPLLTTLSIAAHHHINDVESIQQHLSVLVRYFPALEYLQCINRKHNPRFAPHCAKSWHILSFFAQVLPTLDASVTERKLRVRVR